MTQNKTNKIVQCKLLYCIKLGTRVLAGDQ